MSRLQCASNSRFGTWLSGQEICVLCLPEKNKSAFRTALCRTRLFAHGGLDFSVSDFCLQVGCFLLWTGCVCVSACFHARVGEEGNGEGGRGVITSMRMRLASSVSFLAPCRCGKGRKYCGLRCFFAKSNASSKFKAAFLKADCLDRDGDVRMMMMIIIIIMMMISMVMMLLMMMMVMMI